MIAVVRIETEETREVIHNAVKDHGCVATEYKPGMIEVEVNDPNGDPVDEVTEYLNDAGVVAFVSEV